MGMYRLPQAGRIANYLPAKTPVPHCYYQCRHTPVLWSQKWRPVKLPLVVDDFRVNYIIKQHVEHLTTCVKIYIRCQFIRPEDYTM